MSVRKIGKRLGQAGESDSEFEWCKQGWEALRKHGFVGYPTHRNVVSAKKFLEQLDNLSKIIGTRSDFPFANAVEEIKRLNLVDQDGNWRPHWADIDNVDAKAGHERWLVQLVKDQVDCGVTERTAIATVVRDRYVKGASFEAAWTYLRNLYYAEFPDREKRPRGRPKAEKL